MTANELFLKHAAKHLLQYQGNLRWFCEAVDKGHVPRAGDELIRPYVDRLKRHMRLSAVTEEEEYLLRFGLIVPGVMRGISPPVSVLEPERGGFSDKRLEQAAGQVMRLQAALRTARRYFGELSPSPVEALRKLREKLANVTCDDHAWVDLHAQLPETGSTELAKRALGCLDESKESAELGVDILTCLANLRHEGLGAQTQELVNREIFWPASLYRDAPEAVAKRLVQQIEKTTKSDRVRLSHLLLALAWTRGEFARSTFLAWRSSPPAWAEALYVPPEDYLPHAGWALDCDGNRRELLSLSCHAISPCDGSSVPQFVVPCRTETGTPCPACGGSLVWLFDFANLPAEYFDGDRAQAPRRVLCCLNCACFSPPVFSRYQLDGTAELHPATSSENSEDFGGRPVSVRELVPSPRPPFAATEPFGIDDATSLGGGPMWLQDAEYPRCPECQEVMKFLAQFDNSSMKPPEEGIYHSFFCPQCRVAAVNYEQT